MGKITKSDRAPAGDIYIDTAAGGFSISEGGNYETSSIRLLDLAAENPYLDVEFDAVAVVEKTGSTLGYDPTLDHLSSEASTATIAAAEANEKAIKEVVWPVAEYGPSPTAAELQEEAFDVIGVDSPPVVVESKTEAPTEEPATPVETVEPVPTPPAPTEEPQLEEGVIS